MKTTTIITATLAAFALSTGFSAQASAAPGPVDAAAARRVELRNELAAAKAQLARRQAVLTQMPAMPTRTELSAPSESRIADQTPAPTKRQVRFEAARARKEAALARIAHAPSIPTRSTLDADAAPASVTIALR